MINAPIGLLDALEDSGAVEAYAALITSTGRAARMSPIARAATQGRARRSAGLAYDARHAWSGVEVRRQRRGTTT